MARSWDSGLYDITNFALSLLRQDIHLTPDNIRNNSVGIKCEKMVPLLVDEFIGLHNWAGFKVVVDGNKTRFECSGDYEAALAYHIAAGLAIPITGRQEDYKTLVQIAGAKLQAIKTKDLLIGARSTDDGDVAHVLALVKQIYDPSDHAKPLDINEITNRIEIFKEPARKEVLSSYGWNFIRKEKRNPPCSNTIDGRFMTSIPGDAVKILGCYDMDGEKVEYTIHGGKIISYDIPYRILYTADTDEDISEYPPLVKDAILLKIAENVALGIAASASNGSVLMHKVNSLKNDYARTVQEARTNDAKQISVGARAWGRNYLVDIMLGKRRGKWSARLW